MTARERLLKKRPKKVTIDGDDFYVRSLTLGETSIFDRQTELKKKRDAVDKQLESQSLNEAQRAELEARAKELDELQRKASYFIIVHGLVEDDGTQCFKDDDDPDLAAIPLEMISQLVPEIVKASSPGKLETTIKN